MIIISLISTVLNEEESIKDFLDSILNQTLLPDEIIIVDGGSTDNTLKILKEYKKKYPNLIRVYQLKGANIAKGRNFAIENSNGTIIVTADAGCKYNKDYIKEIVKPLLKHLISHPEKFGLKKEDVLKYLNEKGISPKEILKEEEAEFVQGVYHPLYNTAFEYFAGFLLVKPIEKQYKIPSRTSARATAYFKYVWEAIKGYPERFVTGEDTRFHLEVLKRGFKWVMKKKAKAYWKMPKDIREFYKKFEKYAIGDILQGNLIKYKRLLLFFLGFCLYIALLIITGFYNIVISLCLILIIVLYLILYGFHYLMSTKDIRALIYIPILEALKRTAYQIGFIKGIIKRILYKVNKK